MLQFSILRVTVLSRTLYGKAPSQMQSPIFFTLKFTDLFLKLKDKRLNAGRCMNMYESYGISKQGRLTSDCLSAQNIWSLYYPDTQFMKPKASIY